MASEYAYEITRRQASSCIGCAVRTEIGKHLCESCCERADRILGSYREGEAAAFAGDYFADDAPPAPVVTRARSEEEIEAECWGSMTLVAYCAMCAIGLIVVGVVLGVLA
jgi:hypothetical protein